MKKFLIMAIVTAFTLIFATTGFTQTDQETTNQMGQMMSGQTMMGHHQEMANQATNATTPCPRCPMATGKMATGTMGNMPMHAWMGKNLVATTDGGVVVLIGNKLYKYDKNLNLKHEVEITVTPDGNTQR